jgi:hypothetical protein
MALTDEEIARVAQIEELIAERAERGGPWPAVLGPVSGDPDVFAAVLRDARAAGWDAAFADNDQLVITVHAHLGGPNGA